MNNTTMEQLKTEAEKIINSTDFKNAVSKTIDNKMYCYDWLKKYLHCDNLNPIFKSEENAFNYLVEYICHCMMLDGYKGITKPSNTSVVYFIRNEYNGLLKIGKTNNLKNRILELKRSFTLLGLECNKLSIEAIAYCPYGINNGKVETYYHNMFADKRKIGEWFDVDYDTLISSLYVDYVINDILVTVEDIGDFPNGIKPIKLDELDLNKLKEKVNRELSRKVYDNFYIHEDILSMMSENKYVEISSEDIFDYVVSLKSNEDTNLDNKVKNQIINILNKAS